MTCCPEGLAEAQRREKEQRCSPDDTAKHGRMYDLEEKATDITKKAVRGAAHTDDKVNIKSSKKAPAKRVTAKKVAHNAKQGKGAKARHTAPEKKGPEKETRAQTRAQKDAAKRKQPEQAVEPEVSYQQPSVYQPGQGKKAAAECKQQRVTAGPGAKGTHSSMQLPLPAVRPLVSCLLCFTSCSPPGAVASGIDTNISIDDQQHLWVGAYIFAARNSSQDLICCACQVQLASSSGKEMEEPDIVIDLEKENMSFSAATRGCNALPPAAYSRLI